MYKSLPKSVNIFGHDFSVVVWTKKQAKKAGLMGECVNDKETIYIAPGLGDVALCNTLIHEIQHANFWFTSMDHAENEEEVIVNNLTNGLIAVLRNNPELLKFVFIALQGKKPEPEKHDYIQPIPFVPSLDESRGMWNLINSNGDSIPMYNTTGN